jgi:hypothetical protein
MAEKVFVKNKKELEDFLDYPLDFYFKTLNASITEDKEGFDLTFQGEKIRFDYPFHPFAIMEVLLDRTVPELIAKRKGKPNDNE